LESMRTKIGTLAECIVMDMACLLGKWVRSADATHNRAIADAR
jgi:hypothetical protein